MDAKNQMFSCGFLFHIIPSKGGKGNNSLIAILKKL